MKNLFLLIAALCYISLPNMAFAEKSHEFEINNYTLKFKWMHKLTVNHENAFEIHGTVTKGNPCEKLEVQVAFSNDHYKDNIPVAKAFIENYKPNAKSEFRGETVVKTESKHVPSWGVIDYLVKCLE